MVCNARPPGINPQQGPERQQAGAQIGSSGAKQGLTPSSKPGNAAWSGFNPQAGYRPERHSEKRK